MVVLVCGGRDFVGSDAASALGAALSALNTEERPITKIVHGAARGADTLGALWGLTHAIYTAGYPARWDTYGKAAGIIRNQQMLDDEKIDHAVVCKGGRGTADMLRRLEGAGIPITKVGW